MRTSIDRPSIDPKKNGQRDGKDTRIPSSQGCIALLARLYWMGLGNVILLGVAFMVMQQDGLSAYDILFGMVAASLVVVRYADVRWLHGLTKDGEPADMGHWRRYALIASVAGALLWGVARLASPYLVR